MAKKSMIARDKKREKMIAKYAEKRAAIKARINDPEATPEERFAASQELQQLPLGPLEEVRIYWKETKRFVLELLTYIVTKLLVNSLP